MLVPGDLGAVGGVHHRVELGRDRRGLSADGLEGSAGGRGRGLGSGPAVVGLGQRRFGGGDGRGRPGGDGAGDRALRGALPTADRGPLPGRPLGRGRRGQGVGPAADGAQPLLHGAHLEARLHLGLAGGAGPPGQLGPLLVRLLVLELRVAGPVLVGLGLGQLGLQLGELGQVLLGAALRGADGGVEPLGLVGGRPRGPGQPPQATGNLGRGGVGGAQPAADLLQHLPGLVLRLGRLGQGLRRRLARRLGRGQLGGRVIGGGAHVEQRLRPGRPAVRPVRADQVAVGGHAAKIGVVPNEPGRLGQVRYHHDVGEQLADRARQLGRPGYQVDRPAGADRKGGTSEWRDRGPAESALRCPSLARDVALGATGPFYVALWPTGPVRAGLGGRGDD